MRPRTTVVTAVTAATLALAGSATMSAAAAAQPPAQPVMHHGLDRSEIVSMHDAMLRADTGMATHMDEFGADPDQMRDRMADTDGPDHPWHSRHGAAADMHDAPVGMSDASHGSTRMHD